jgi:transposase-like protein
MILSDLIFSKVNMKCPKCKSENLFYNGFGLVCNDCNNPLNNVNEITALEIAFKKKSKSDKKNTIKQNIESLQKTQSNKKYLRLRYFEVE